MTSKCEWPKEWCFEQLRQQPQSWVAGQYIDHLISRLKHRTGKAQLEAQHQMMQLLLEGSLDAWKFFSTYKDPWKNFQQEQKAHLDDLMYRLFWTQLRSGNLNMDCENLPEFFSQHNYLGPRIHCLNRLIVLRRTLTQ